MYDRTAAQFDIEKKSILVSYLLWFFLGYLGVHRFYLGRPVSGMIMLLSTVVIGIISFLSFGLLGFLFAIMFVWWLLDALLIPGMAAGTNGRTADRVFGRRRPY